MHSFKYMFECLYDAVRHIMSSRDLSRVFGGIYRGRRKGQRKLIIEIMAAG